MGAHDLAAFSHFLQIFLCQNGCGQGRPLAAVNASQSGLLGLPAVESPGQEKRLEPPILQFRQTGIALTRHLEEDFAISLAGMSQKLFHGLASDPSRDVILIFQRTRPS